MAPRTIKGRFGRRALATVEAALVLPVIVLVLFGALEYGILFFRAELVQNAARNGARTGALADVTSEEAVRAVVTDYLSRAGVSGQVVTVSSLTVDKGQPVTVTVNLPRANFGWSDASLVPLPSAIQASVTMAKEGP